MASGHRQEWPNYLRWGLLLVQYRQFSLYTAKINTQTKITITRRDILNTVNLRKMLKNQKGTIKAVSVAGELGRRLREMGLTPGTEISVCGRAPLYDPVAIKVLDTTLTLRNNEADHIFVTVD